jgi:hypothetical protein
MPKARLSHGSAQYQPAHLTAGVVDGDLHVLGEVEPHLGEHFARLFDDPRTVGRILVPARWQTEQLPRIARNSVQTAT